MSGRRWNLTLWRYWNLGRAMSGRIDCNRLSYSIATSSMRSKYTVLISIIPTEVLHFTPY
jgi:hypothetical protein